MKSFTKADLKNRMVVEYRNGGRRMVVGDMLMGLNSSGFLYCYNDDLTCNAYGGSGLDIVKVFNGISLLNEMESSVSVLWQRSEVKEVTMAEVEEKFGCKVKIIRGQQQMKDFTKSDLENGMVIEQRCGTRKIVVGDKIVGYEEYGELQRYDDNLLHHTNPGLDIVKIYKPADTIRLALRSNILQLLWQRSEVKEVTMSEIEEKFGCKVKIVKE